MGSKINKAFRGLSEMYEYFEFYNLIPVDEFYDMNYYQSVFNIRVAKVESLPNKKINQIMKILNISVCAVDKKDLSNFKIKSFKNFLRVEGLTHNNKWKRFLYYYNLHSRSLTVDLLS